MKLRRSRRGEPALIPATVLVGFLLATGRWGSYLGLPAASIYVTDVVLAVTAAWLVARHRRRVERRLVRPLLPALTLAAWSVVRFATGGTYDLVALRDLAPYAYVLVCLAWCFTASAYRRSYLVVGAALLLHLAWVWVALLAPGWVESFPLLGGRVRVFELRQDFDGASMAVLACLAGLTATRRHLSPAARAAAVILATAASYTILELGSRAGLLALGTSLAVIAITRLHGVLRAKRAHILAGAAAAVAVAGLAVLVLPQTYIFDRVTAGRLEPQSGAGTVDAREYAWRLIIEDATEDPARLLLGSGFGPDFLDRSGAAFAFEGYVEKGVRAPHNFVLNTLGRTGLVGVALLLWVGASLARPMLARRGAPGAATDRELLVEIAALLVAALGIASLVGVILESPFGAVPFWWAAGLVLTSRSHPEAASPPLTYASTNVR